MEDRTADAELVDGVESDAPAMLALAAALRRGFVRTVQIAIVGTVIGLAYAWLRGIA